MANPAAKVHFARMAVLFAIGWIHYHLIWWGDILKDYAVTGCLAFFWRRASREAAAGLGDRLLCFRHAVLRQLPDRSVLQWDQAAHAAGASEASIADSGTISPDGLPTGRRHRQGLALHRGGWLGIATLLGGGKPFSWVQGTLFFLPETLALMLFGMAGYKSGFLTGEWDNRRYLRMGGRRHFARRRCASLPSLCGYPKPLLRPAVFGGVHRRAGAVPPAAGGGLCGADHPADP